MESLFGKSLAGMGFTKIALVRVIKLDRWLLNQRCTCPTCGSAAYTSLDGDGIVTPDINTKYLPVSMPVKARRLKQKEPKLKDKEIPPKQQLSITGIYALPSRLPPIQFPIAHAAEKQASDTIINTTKKNDNFTKSRRKVSSQEGRKTWGLPPLIIKKPTVADLELESLFIGTRSSNK